MWYKVGVKFEVFFPYGYTTVLASYVEKAMFSFTELHLYLRGKVLNISPSNM